MPILRYTETYQAVAGASAPTELIRGLGYWFFYGSDRLDTWVGPSLPYLDNSVLIGFGFGIAAIGLLGFLRSFVGRASARPAPRRTRRQRRSGTARQLHAVRSPLRVVRHRDHRRTRPPIDTHAAPLVVLALALGLASSTEWLRAHLRTRSAVRWDLFVPIGAVALIGLQLFPWFTGAALTPSLLRDDEVPEHQTELADWLDASPGDGRVFEFPAADFAAYRWGGTVDPLLPDWSIVPIWRANWFPRVAQRRQTCSTPSNDVSPRVGSSPRRSNRLHGDSPLPPW